MTYLLGVGDRHLDNLLLAPDGAFTLLTVSDALGLIVGYFVGHFFHGKNYPLRLFCIY